MKSERASEDPLRCALICQRDAASEGGAPRVAVEYARRLPDWGIEPRLFFLYGGKGPFARELPQAVEHLELSSSRQVWKFPRLLQRLRAFAPHVVHHHDGILWPLLLTGCLQGTPRLLHGHLPPPDPSSRGFRERVLRRLLGSGGIAAICLSPDAVEDYRKAGCEQIFVCGNGVDLTRFRPPSGEERREARDRLGIIGDQVALGFVGRLHIEMKGVDVLVRSLAHLPSNHVLVLVGGGPDGGRLAALARDLGVEGRIRFAGLVECVEEAYRAFDVFCMTSRYEPFGLVIVEAFATGVPVVALPCRGGAMELLGGDRAWVARDHTAECLAEQVRDLLARPGEAARRAALASAYAKANCDWDAKTSGLAAVYRQLAGRDTGVFTSEEQK